MLRARESDGEFFSQRIAYRCLLYITLMNSEVKLKMTLLREEGLGFHCGVMLIQIHSNFVPFSVGSCF